MWKAVRENPRAVAYAVLMHVGLLLLLVFSLDWTPKVVKPGVNKPIQAELVDMTKVRELEAQKKAEQEKLRKAEADRKKKIEQEKQRKVEAERKKKAEQEKQRKAEADRKKKAEQEKKRKAEAERKKKAEQEKQRKAEAERKKKAEQEKQRKAEAERKKKAEQEKQRAAEAARQKEAEQALQAQLAEEAAQARAESALSQYIPYIQEKIESNWRRPAGSPPGLSCVIRVKLIPGGEVASASVVQSSGDALFDRSVETAVLKASPLPLPEDPAMFKYFREINFRFVPD